MTPEVLAAIQARAVEARHHPNSQLSIVFKSRMDIEDRETLLEALRESEADNARLRVMWQACQRMAAFEPAEDDLERLRGTDAGDAVIAFWSAYDVTYRALAEPSADGDLVSSHESGINPMTGGL